LTFTLPLLHRSVIFSSRIVAEINMASQMFKLQNEHKSQLHTHPVLKASMQIMI